MAYLFVDTSELLTVGLLDEQFQWLEYHELEDKKSSALIHSFIYELLSKHGLKLENIAAYFQVAGPGSYTGMRVSEGISQVLNWQGMKVYSFYHFEVPKLLGEKSGAWISKAFKGEAFIYSWNNEDVDKELVSLEALDENLDAKTSTLFTHFSGNFERELAYTSKMIKASSSELFPIVVEKNLKREPFYYRALEKEFKTSKK